MIYVVTTCYNKINFLTFFFTTIKSILKKKKHHIIVVDDGSTDGSKELLLKIKKKNFFFLINKKNSGKGFSLKRGIGKIKKFYSKDVILLVDLDLPYIEKINKFLTIKKNSIKIITRRKKNYKSSVKLEKINFQCISRYLLGYLVNYLFRFLRLTTLLDTQAGLKSFSGSLIPEVKKIKTNNFLFDLELLIIFQKKNILIEEIYSKYTVSSKSSISLFNLKIVKNFIIDFFKIFFYFYKGSYD
jgi:glycosyltransferase involved in cell wall biosynthesis